MSEKILISNIGYLIKTSKLSRLAWCKKVGIGRQTVGAWFEGRAVLQTPQLLKISNKCKVSIDYLVRNDLSKLDIYDVRADYMFIQRLMKT